MQMVYMETVVFKSVVNITNESVLPGESDHSIFGCFFQLQDLWSLAILRESNIPHQR